ncbi:ATP-binding protein [Sphingomonas citri]|jgi:two-component system, OmpR family, sensor histidine kinase TctE|uniref:histidine kinase n=1 Tax=Sphingomonas citri TaxID=2862499 RepID=A0ABS7BKU0_9SPHN|nr:sensor histidine kinase [Sphingomonas citri]MBW6530234.1 sensor histidine kinase [Sphingomonas citri]
MVADDGPGLSDADIARAGVRFTRSTTSAGQDGSGLGLAIVRSAAQRLGASVEIGDTRPCLRVTLRFPDAAPDPTRRDSRG